MSQVVKAVQITSFGGPEVLKFVDVSIGEPGPGEARVRHHAIGLNYIDIYQRSGVYPNNLPAILGMEGAGVVEAVGEVAQLALGAERAVEQEDVHGGGEDARGRVAAVEQQVDPFKTDAGHVFGLRDRGPDGGFGGGEVADGASDDAM